MLLIIVSCLVLGAIAGLLAGLLGIGGGLIIVPALHLLFPYIGVPDAYLMSTTLATSFATIVITGFSSAQRHHKLGNVDLSAAKYLIPALMFAVFIAGLFISNLPKAITSKVFAVIVIYLALNMLLSIKPNVAVNSKNLTPQRSVIGGVIIGIISSFAGIGGGGFIVPFLTSHGLNIKKAIGTSALCGVFLAFAGMTSFIIGGWEVDNLPVYFVGYVYLPAVVLITSMSVITSKIGASLTEKLSTVTLKKVFAALLCLIAANMLLS